MTSQPTLSFTNADGTLKTAEQLQAEIDARVQDAQRRAHQLKTEIAEASAEATSRNQAATVVVAPGGGVRAIRLTDRVRSMPPAMIAAAIMEAYAEAGRAAAELTIEITQRYADPRVVERLREIVPSPAVPPEDPAGAVLPASGAH